jgi:hypothetical protein
MVEASGVYTREFIVDSPDPWGQTPLDGPPGAIIIEVLTCHNL